MAHRIPKDANARYFRAAVAHQTSVQRLSAGLAGRVAALMAPHDRDLARILRRRLPSLLGRRFDLNDPRWAVLFREIRENRKRATRAVRDELRPLVVELSQNETRVEEEIMAAALLPFAASLNPPDLRALRTEILRTPYGGGNAGGGKTFQQWFNSVFRFTTAQISDIVQTAVSEQAAIDSIVAQVIGTRGQGFFNGATATMQQHLATVVRTTVNHISTSSRGAVWAANSGLISHLQWRAVLDDKTSVICRGRDGRNAPLDGKSEVPPPRLVPSNARPPAHPRCRSIMIIVFRGGGPVPGMNYAEFLRGQPVGFQNEVLGTTKARLFRRGDLSLDKFTDRAGGELTIAELAQTQPQAFAAAGLVASEFQ